MQVYKPRGSLAITKFYTVLFTCIRANAIVYGILWVSSNPKFSQLIKSGKVSNSIRELFKLNSPFLPVFIFLSVKYFDVGVCSFEKDFAICNLKWHFRIQITNKILSSDVFDYKWFRFTQIIWVTQVWIVIGSQTSDNVLWLSNLWLRKGVWCCLLFKLKKKGIYWAT